MSQRVFREFFARVSAVMQGCLDQFTAELLSANLIPWEVAKEVSETLGLTPAQKSNKLLFAVQSKMVGEESDEPFKSLCHVMGKNSVLEGLARQMMEKFGEYFLCYLQFMRYYVLENFHCLKRLACKGSLKQ